MRNISSEFILALDVESFKEAKYFIDLLYPKVKIFKVGSQLFTACGPKVIELIRAKGRDTFLDLKFHDIPNTVANAVRAAVRLKVKMLTLHIAGGEEMLKISTQAAKEEAAKLKIKRPWLIGVTVLTSQKSSPQSILKLAKLGLNCGLDGVVCSALEAKVLRKNIRKKFIIVTPGIRAKNAAADDQKRTAIASAAFRAGANFIVVGRPILKAVDPLQALASIL